MEDNIIELEEKDGLTKLKLNGCNINKLLCYKISKKELDHLELTITIDVNSKKSSIKI